MKVIVSEGHDTLFTRFFTNYEEANKFFERSKRKIKKGQDMVFMTLDKIERFYAM